MKTNNGRKRSKRPGRSRLRSRRLFLSGRRSINELEFVTDTCPGYNLGKAYKRVTREFESEFRDSGLSLAQFALLVNIGRGEPASGSQIARRLGSDLSTLSRTIELLVKRGLVAQRRGEDRRVRIYSLTEAGRASLAESLPKWRTAKHRTLREIDGSQWRRTLRQLRQLGA